MEEEVTGDSLRVEVVVGLGVDGAAVPARLFDVVELVVEVASLACEGVEAVHDEVNHTVVVFSVPDDVLKVSRVDVVERARDVWRSEPMVVLAVDAGDARRDGACACHWIGDRLLARICPGGDELPIMDVLLYEAFFFCLYHAVALSSSTISVSVYDFVPYGTTPPMVALKLIEIDHVGERKTSLVDPPDV
jgi:hypothetical protein